MSQAPPPATTVETTKSATPSNMRPKADELLRNRASCPSQQSSTAELKMSTPAAGKCQRKLLKMATPAAQPSTIEPDRDQIG